VIAARKRETRNRKIEITRSKPERELRDEFALVAAGFGTVEVSMLYPHPGCFCERVWICLSAKELNFLERDKEFAIV
jgi:hypothetical protein